MMAWLHYIRQCTYWLFLVMSVAFLLVSLLLLLPEPLPALSWAHPFTLYGVVVSLLLSSSTSVTLWLCRDTGAEPTNTTTLFISLGSCILVSGMIATFLFFL